MRLFHLFTDKNPFLEELRGLESRCHRIQNNMDRIQSDRLQFLRQVASIINVPEPCETLIKDKLRELTNHNQVLHTVMIVVSNITSIFEFDHCLVFKVRSLILNITLLFKNSIINIEHNLTFLYKN